MIDRIPKPGDRLTESEVTVNIDYRPGDVCVLRFGRDELTELFPKRVHGVIMPGSSSSITVPRAGFVTIISVARDLHRGHWFDKVTFMYDGHLFEYDRPWLDCHAYEVIR